MNEKNKDLEAGKTHGKIVKVLYRGTGGWAILYPKRGIISLGPGDIQSFRLDQARELAVLLNIIKQINLPKQNKRVDKQSGKIGGEVIERFSIVEGLENLPKILQVHSFSLRTGFTEEEEEAIKTLCPDFFITKKEAKT